MALEDRTLHVVGVGGTLRENSRSAWALERALRAAETAGARTTLFTIYDLDLPLYRPGTKLDDYPARVRQLLDTVRTADALIWSTAAYNGSVAGATKNTFDFFDFLKRDDPPFLTNKVIGLIAVGGGDQAAVNTITAMMHIATALRGTLSPLYVPIPQAGDKFDDSRGILTSDKWGDKVDQLGKLVVKMAANYRAGRQREHTPARP